MNNIKRVKMKKGSAIIYFSSWQPPEGTVQGFLALDFESTLDLPYADEAAVEIVRRVFPDHT